MSAEVSASSGDLEGAVDAYWRSATQLWFLPLKVCDTLKGATTLKTTQFRAKTPAAVACRCRLSLSMSFAPGLPYASRSEALPDSAIGFESAVLEPGNNTFRLLVEATALDLRPGATYWGEVTVADDASGTEIERVMVWLVVS